MFLAIPVLVRLAEKLWLKILFANLLKKNTTDNWQIRYVSSSEQGVVVVCGIFSSARSIIVLFCMSNKIVFLPNHRKAHTILYRLNIGSTSCTKAPRLVSYKLRKETCVIQAQKRQASLRTSKMIAFTLNISIRPEETYVSFTAI